MVVFFCATSAFLFGVLLMRKLRKSIQEESDLGPATPSLEALPIHVYSTVIQQLKQQKHELEMQAQAEQQRSRSSESFSQAVLTNLSCGVLAFSPNGLIKSSNSAAKEILGFGSTTGMGAEDIFRGAVVTDAQGSLPESNEDVAEPVCLSDEVAMVLRGASRLRQAKAEYETPAGLLRYLAVTISAVPAEDGSLLGVACVIDNLSADARQQQPREAQSSLSAEMAQQLHSSLAAISDSARQLNSAADIDSAKQLANEIARQAADLDHSFADFIPESSTTQDAAAAAAGMKP